MEKINDQNGVDAEGGEGGGIGEGHGGKVLFFFNFIFCILKDAKDVTDEMEETGQIEGLQVRFQFL